MGASRVINKHNFARKSNRSAIFLMWASNELCQKIYALHCCSAIGTEKWRVGEHQCRFGNTRKRRFFACYTILSIFTWSSSGFVHAYLFERSIYLALLSQNTLFKINIPVLPLAHYLIRRLTLYTSLESRFMCIWSNIHLNNNHIKLVPEVLIIALVSLALQL